MMTHTRIKKEKVSKKRVRERELQNFIQNEVTRNIIKLDEKNEPLFLKIQFIVGVS